jgi:hypothetical protein
MASSSRRRRRKAKNGSDSMMSSRPAQRGCRVYQQRTQAVVCKATASWVAISGVAVEPNFPKSSSCSELARYVKRFLGTEVSSDPSLQMGFQSIKKLLPDSCRCMESGMIDALVARLGETPRELPIGYLSFVEKEVLSLFPKGWDAAYEGYCLTTVPPIKAAIRLPRSEGGSLSVSGDLFNGQAGYLSRVLHGFGGRLCPSYRGQMLVVQSAGKPRPLSKFPAEALYLKPVHKTIYSRLSKFSWLLRGPPTEERCARAGFRSHRGRLVSGDYSSATDNLPIEVMEVALRAMFANSTFIPSNVRELALRACRPILFSESTSFEVTVGQMMGSLLSFPFLCLQNYLAFRWSVESVGLKRKIPVLINGDDILYQSPFEGFDQIWRSVVNQVGLEVEVTKTSVSGLYGSLNSTLLRWDEFGLLGPVWSPRFGMLLRPDDVSSLGKTFESFLAGCPVEFRFNAGKEFFKWHSGSLRSAGVSLPSLGFRGLLARRLARLFKFLHFGDAELPRYPSPHECGFPDDFIVPVPYSQTDAELRFHSSVETAAMVWSRGYVPTERSRNLIRYCMRLSALRRGRFDYPHVPHPDVWPCTSFGWSLSDPARVWRSRKTWLMPRFTEALVNICQVVLDDSFHFEGSPPRYGVWDDPVPDEFFVPPKKGDDCG